MRIIELSNHPEHLRAEHEAGRRAEQARLERERADARKRLAELKAQRRQALIRLRLGAWARAAASARAIRQQLAPFPSIISAVPSAGEEIAAAGRDGEDRIAAQLDAALGDNWVLYRGYRNARGEIDGVLAGPGGLGPAALRPAPRRLVPVAQRRRRTPPRPACTRHPPSSTRCPRTRRQGNWPVPGLRISRQFERDLDGFEVLERDEDEAAGVPGSLRWPSSARCLQAVTHMLSA